jgi:hypothetical protein
MHGREISTSAEYGTRTLSTPCRFFGSLLLTEKWNNYLQSAVLSSIENFGQ